MFLFLHVARGSNSQISEQYSMYHLHLLTQCSAAGHVVDPVIPQKVLPCGAHCIPHIIGWYVHFAGNVAKHGSHGCINVRRWYAGRRDLARRTLARNKSVPLWSSAISSTG